MPTLSTTFVLNDRQLQVDLDPRATLADAVRASGATGTRVGCEEGVCGSCTVLVDDRPTRACLMLAAQAGGRRVRTIEGLAVDGVLHPVQQAFRDERALQCGFCTTGFVMLAVGLLEDEPDASPERITEVLSSNLCRCTGYAPIVHAAAAAQRSVTAATP